MKKIILMVVPLLFTVTGQAAEYECHASKYPTDMVHAFANGELSLSINDKALSIRFFQKSSRPVKSSKLSFEATYKLGNLLGGNGALKNMLVAQLVEGAEMNGDSTIPTLYVSPELLTNNDLDKSTLIGKIAFLGQGYSYDFNLCYNLNEKSITTKLSDFKAQFEEYADNEYPFGNGDYGWEKYQIAKFSSKDIVKALEKSNARDAADGYGCKMIVSSGIASGLSALKEYTYDEATAELIANLSKQGLVNEIIANEWAGDTDDSESCSIYRYDVYLNDGTSLYLNYELTD